LRDYGIDGQIGMEETPELFVAKIVEVFREVKRVLRDDGTLWLNFGDSYASAPAGNFSEDMPKPGDGGAYRTNKPKLRISSNLLYPLQCCIKGNPLFIGDARTIRITSKSGDIPAPDNGFPYLKFINLLGIERVSIKQRDNNFHQVIHTLTNPRYAWIGVPIFSMVVNLSDIEIVLDSGYDVSIIISDLNPNGEAVLGIDAIACTWAGGDCNSTLTIKETAKPTPETIGNVEPVGDAIALNTGLKRFPDIYLIDKAIPFRDAFSTMPGNLCDFGITKATNEEINFALGDTGCNLGINIVTHFFTIDNNGCLIPYSYLLLQAQRYYNSHKAKQELGIPELVKRAMMEDGWYCRSTIIWSKPNPMPESVTDRPTKAHEYVFLMTKSARYYYDADAIRETYKESSLNRFESNFRSDTPSAQATKNPSVKIDGKISANPSGRNARTVWEIATQPTPEAHFATFPEALVEPCIKAGTSERGCCAVCGAPWERIVEKGEPLESQKKACGADSEGGYNGISWKYENFLHGKTGFSHEKENKQQNASDVKRRILDGMKERISSWQPTCKCNADTVPCVVLDPFGGSGTTAKVARDLKRDAIMIELNPVYVKIMKEKLRLNEQLVV